MRLASVADLASARDATYAGGKRGRKLGKEGLPTHSYVSPTAEKCLLQVMQHAKSGRKRLHGWR